jgi:hypothetical protein
MNDRGSNRYLTTGQLARRLGCFIWQIHKALERKLIPEPARAGNLRLFAESDLPAIEAALRTAGYLRTEGAACA